MKYNFNGTEIELKDKLCRLWDTEEIEIEPTTNLYIRVTNECNAKCKFCEYHGNKKEFSIEKLEKALYEIAKRNIVYKIQLTGGEPTLNPNLLEEICKTIRKYFKSNFLGINTNGTNLKTCINLQSLIDNFAISRHHYDDKINREIFGISKVPSTSELRDFIKEVGKDKVHLSCNLMKSYIGNVEEVKKYLEYCSEIGCNDVGFVSLMPVNDIALNEQIIFNNIGIENNDEFLKYKQFTKCDGCCMCANYIYFCNSTQKLIDIYGRFVIDRDNTSGILSFDGDILRNGFSGDTIAI